MTAVADARSNLYDAIVAVGAGVLPTWRVHRTPPAQLAAPCVFLDSTEFGQSAVAGATLVVVTFPVTAVVDGTVVRQVEQLDDVLAYVWTAALASGGDPTYSRPVSLDVGGPNLRAHVLRVDVTLTAMTLCQPSLVGTSNGGTP